MEKKAILTNETKSTWFFLFMSYFHMSAFLMCSPLGQVKGRGFDHRGARSMLGDTGGGGR